MFGLSAPLSRRTHLQRMGSAAAWLAIPWASAEGNVPTPQVRLLTSPTEWESLAQRRKLDPDLDRFANLLLARARKDVALPVQEHKLEGRRLLGVSREHIRRTLQWAFAFRVTGETIFLERTRREMVAVAAFPDWNPNHYLDVAEMTTAMAIGYDWLYAELQESDRAAIRSAIVEKGIAQARHGHKTYRYTNNWNQVCIGGMVLGALAVQGQEPQLAREILAAAQPAVALGLEAYAPDGAYPEGPGYWSYGTSYSVLLAAALRSAAEADWGVMSAPGFARSALYYAHSIGPSGKHFNYADGNEGQELPCPIVYLARELNSPELLHAKREMIRKNQGLSERFAPLSILWWPAPANGNAPPLHYLGQGSQPVTVWRSSWSDPNALWFAIKGGGAAHNHAHMDAGSFVLDMDGLRWAKDLGMQDYNSLESRGVDLWNMKPDSPRWKVYRLGAQAHNTLTVNGQRHSTTAMATLRQLNEHEVEIDLSDVLGVGKATRRARFTSEAVRLEDTVIAAGPQREIRWAMCTDAEIQLEHRAAILRLRGKSLRIDFSGQDIQLAVLDISTPRTPLDLPNPGTRQLVATAPVRADDTWQLGVLFSRGQGPDSAP